MTLLMTATMTAPQAIAELSVPSAAAHSAQHECDDNCMYCWGPETD
jgi:hypothetical protein